MMVISSLETLLYLSRPTFAQNARIADVNEALFRIPGLTGDAFTISCVAAFK